MSVGMGVVGGGLGNDWKWQRHPDATVVAVCDRHEERLQDMKKIYGCDNAYRDYGQFLKHPGLDAVAVISPAPFHAALAVEAMKLGKHVISAVPAGLSVEELEQLLHTVKQTGVKYMMAEISRYHPEVMACIDMAKEGKFGNVFYSEAEYHHSGLAVYAYGTSFDCQSCLYSQIKNTNVDVSSLVPTWSYGYPPMLYPTHCTGMIIPVIGERLTEVTAYGWGDGSEMLKKNYYNDNPFFHTVALFKTSKGNSARVSIGWHIAAGSTERAAFYGDRGSFIMKRPEGSPDTVVVQKDSTDSPFGLYAGEIESNPFTQSGQGDSQTHLVNEFIGAIVEDRHPAVNIYESIAYTLPGIVAHQSALEGGRRLPIRDYGTAPA